jgi:hypothetical protein
MMDLDQVSAQFRAGTYLPSPSSPRSKGRQTTGERTLDIHVASFIPAHARYGRTAETKMTRTRGGWLRKMSTGDNSRLPSGALGAVEHNTACE